MKQYQFDVELMRDDKIIAKSKVWEFDDECLGQNLFGGACYEFKDIIKTNDIVILHYYRTDYLRINEDGNGTLLNIY